MRRRTGGFSLIEVLVSVVVVSVGALDKMQVIDAVYENREKRQEEPFVSLRLMHGEEVHLLLALNEEERKSLTAFAAAVSQARNPEQ